MAVRVVRSLTDVDAAQWNALVGRGAPFLRHEFLFALEQSGCATAETGWDAHHLLLTDSRGRLAAAMPLYLKPHSWGEFVFDFAWAEAYQRAGLSYYPRLCCAVPFTPATGPRLLTLELDAAANRQALIGAARELARTMDVSSLHFLFPDMQDKAELEAAGLMTRLDCQFHWQNADYGSFDDFLAGFTAEKRKKVRRERRRVAESGFTHRTLHGGDLDEALINTIYTLHAQTFARFGNPPYLNPDFFQRLARSMPDALVVEIALRHDEVVACSLSLRSDDTLYGRYWGASRDVHSLHFETCFYRGIEYCIRERLARFEPGTQGEHKLLRGFAPAPVWSLHEITDPRFAAAIRDWLKRERSGRRAYLRAAADHLPFRRADIPARLAANVRDCMAAED